ncbi:MAG TPA: hypothetical protein VF194_06760 [Ferrovibrio sp.]|uniref:hypothetical protein n=1 Tax=Ferrovibrio sp. TaxID=1917215 RepID=UPI002ED31F8E
MKGWAAVLLSLLGLAGCSGLGHSVRDLNRTLYHAWSGESGQSGRRPADGAEASTTPCFSPETGLLYPSQTGRCAPGYTPIAQEQAERQFGAVKRSKGATTQTAPSSVSANAAASSGGGSALCYNDTLGHVFEAPSCPSGSRWVTAAEAEALQRAQLTGASWCYYASRHLLYRSQACRPGDQVLDTAQADALWDKLPPERRPRTRPVETAGAVQPVPPIEASPRGGVSATPLPAPK